MKRLNLNILAIVGILAIGMTAFTKTDPAGKRITVTNCYRDIDVLYEPVIACTQSAFSFDINDACNATLLAQDEEGLDRTPAAFQSSIICDEITTFFCCAKLAVDPSPCAGQPLLTFTDGSGASRVNQFAKVDVIYCKSTSN